MAERSLKQVANETTANTLADAANAVPLGNALANGVQSIRAVVASNVMVLPEGFKAALVLGGYAVDAGTTGVLNPAALGATVATTQVAIDPKGDLLFFGADAVVEAEVFYIPAEGSLIEETIAVTPTTGVASMGANRKGRVLVEVSASTGGVPGAKTVAARGATPSTGLAQLNDDGVITFLIADAITQATVKYIQYPVSVDGAGVPTGTSVGDKLAAESTLL